MFQDNRRQFIRKTSLGITGAVATNTLAVKAANAANAQIRLALIGCGGRGTSVIRDFAKFEGVEIAFALHQAGTRNVVETLDLRVVQTPLEAREQHAPLLQRALQAGFPELVEEVEQHHPGGPP